MNLYEQQPNFENNKAKTKKLMIILGITIIILFILSIGLIFYISYIEKNKFKCYINNARVSIKSDTMIIDENKNNIYVSLEDIADKIGYTKNNGEYKDPYSEDVDKCYLQNKYETVSYITESNQIYKAILSESQSSDADYEYFEIDEPVFMSNNKMYTTIDGISKGCNLAYSYNKDNNTLKIYTMNYLSTSYAKTIPESAEIAAQDNVESYKNKKAILYDMIVVKNTAGKYGVKNSSNNTIIGEKYKSISFEEEEEEFIVETDDGKFGIIDKTGKTKITPDYTSIKLISKARGLYLVSKTSSASKMQYGIINKNERVIVYIEYEQIGISKSDFPTNEIDNPYILFEKCIPVKRSNKWGLLDLNGNTIASLEFDSLGCLSNSSKNNQANSLVVIPEYEAIVVRKDGLYGLYNSSGKELILPLVTDMYVINNSGENQYYLTYQGNTMNVIEYLKNVLGLEPVTNNSSNEKTNNSNNSSTNSSNEIANNNEL